MSSNITRIYVKPVVLNITVYHDLYFTCDYFYCGDIFIIIHIANNVELYGLEFENKRLSLPSPCGNSKALQKKMHGTCSGSQIHLSCFNYSIVLMCSYLQMLNSQGLSRVGFRHWTHICTTCCEPFHLMILCAHDFVTLSINYINSWNFAKNRSRVNYPRCHVGEWF